MGFVIGQGIGLLIGYAFAAGILGWLAARKNRNPWA